MNRHDIIHLLTSLLTPSAQRAQSKSRVSSGSPGSVSSATTSSSWNDLPSDLEETFFLSGSEEIEEYERGKKRLWMEALREERLKKRQKEDEARAEEGNGKGKGREAGWGEDEEAVGRSSSHLHLFTVSRRHAGNSHCFGSRTQTNISHWPS